MKLAIMQPYFLPYIGYFQLIAAVDKFILLDDVNYIQRGWINRNRIALLGAPAWLTIPLMKASQNRLICDIDILPDHGWKEKIWRTLEMVYARAPEREVGLNLMQDWLKTACGRLSEWLYVIISDLVQFFGLTTVIVPTSRIYPKQGLTGQARILDICRQENATHYINALGGRNLYDQARFRDAGIDLLFIEPKIQSTRLRTGLGQYEVLSILDHIMLNPRESLIEAVKTFDLSVP